MKNGLEWDKSENVEAVTEGQVTEMVMWTRDGWELTGLLTRVAAHIYRVHHGGQACFQMCNMRYLLESPMRQVHDPHWCEGTPGRRGQT